LFTSEQVKREDDGIYPNNTLKLDFSKMRKNNAQLIRGYLPVRVMFDGMKDDDSMDQSFFYVKEHFVVAASNDDGTKNNTKQQKQSTTLFVANAPFYPNISTKILLRSILGRYADIERVSVVNNPRHNTNNESSEDNNKQDVSSSSYCWWNDTSGSQKQQYYPSIYDKVSEQGKFSHVVFRTTKEMKKALACLHEIMSSEDELPGLKVDKLEIQTLKDESLVSSLRKDNMDDDDDVALEEESKEGILAVARRYRNSMKQNILSRADLMDQCNDTMQDYEDAEEEAAAAKANPSVDDDGFVTVNYSKTVSGNKRQFEDDMVTTTNRKSGSSKRSRGAKKKFSGATPLDSFYRFQQKENRKNTVQALRLKFQQDLEKVKKLKEENHYRPFS